MSAQKLYTPAMLAAAVELAQYPPMGDAKLHGQARSSTCGSTLSLDLETDPAGAIIGLGLRVHACAVGQAAAAVFARHAKGGAAEDMGAAHRSLEQWLAGEAAQPDWPDLDLIAPALAFPARHGAMLLPWKAAISALSTAPASS